MNSPAKTLSLENVKGFKTAPTDENELCMVDWCSHNNDKLNLQHSLKVRVVNNTEQDVNGGVVNDVRIK